MATPVDQDKDGTLLAEARAECENTPVLAQGMDLFKSILLRDSLSADGKNLWIDYETLYPLLDQMNCSGIRVYSINGMFDINASNNFLIFNNLTVQKRLLIRPGQHAGAAVITCEPGPVTLYLHCPLVR